jgi:nitroimidazol reductase NimA-like FMN-containing flavoprotein (pyridoxamine 5'-phosphate oxidase superfamily)
MTEGRDHRASTAGPPSARTRVRRLPQRGAYELATIEAILDEGLVCHVAFVDDGQPFVLPTAYARIGSALYLHGSHSNRMLRLAAAGEQLCVTVTLLDGLVLARSAFHHSMNYRSVVVLGRARPVDDRAEKEAAFQALVEHVCPGRWRDARWPDARETDATLVVALDLAEASAKVRTGPPVDDEADLTLDVWAGVVPLTLVAGRPLDAPDLRADPVCPDYAQSYQRGVGSGRA